ncbi:MAG: hypothetical protein A3K54_02895 [Omnitrophica WOR_2 bacterium RBG_13_44_8]|nr:MAG: hypothetical protein A3K54_02895 [Omnitrophica WOR_2 bacterium RBG_13_44_8]
MVTKRDYTADAVGAARSVMLELSHLLGEYRDGIVIVGGWVPELLLSRTGQRHIGSLDVDLALDHQRLDEVGYKTILQLLLTHGYRQGEQPYIFFRTVQVKGIPHEVQVDFLSGEYLGTGHSHRTQKVQDMRPRKARGCDLAFDQVVQIELSGTLPEGGKDNASIRVTAITRFIAMKAIAMASRLKEKDAWDIYYCLRNYPGGFESLALEFKPLLKNNLILEAIIDLKDKFASPDHIGPKHVADFEEITDPDERALLQRDVYERVHALLARLEQI